SATLIGLLRADSMPRLFQQHRVIFTRGPASTLMVIPDSFRARRELLNAESGQNWTHPASPQSPARVGTSSKQPRFRGKQQDRRISSASPIRARSERQDTRPGPLVSKCPALAARNPSDLGHHRDVKYAIFALCARVGGPLMLDRSVLHAIVLAATLGMAGTEAVAFDESKYPDWSGQWLRPPGVGFQWDITKRPG